MTWQHDEHSVHYRDMLKAHQMANAFQKFPIGYQVMLGTFVVMLIATVVAIGIIFGLTYVRGKQLLQRVDLGRSFDHSLFDDSQIQEFSYDESQSFKEEAPTEAYSSRLEISRGAAQKSDSVVYTGPVLDNLPTAAFLDDVPIGKQTRSLNCEFQSASDLAWYYGLPYTSDELFMYVGHDPGGNPHVGFVGRSLGDPPGQLYPKGYGVYAEPIAKALQEIGLNAEVHYGQSVEWLKAQVADGQPVMVWATANMTPAQTETWLAGDGVQVLAVRGEHTYLVLGYDAEGVWVGDPWDGLRYHYSWDVFLTSWNLLDRMSLVVDED